jgi:hypothetical protein
MAVLRELRTLGGIQEDSWNREVPTAGRVFGDGRNGQVRRMENRHQGKEPLK